MKKLSVFGTSILLAGMLGGCSSSAGNGLTGVSSTYQKECDDWDKKKDGSMKCDDEHSRHYGGYWFNGGYYGNRASLVSSSSYKQNNLVNGTARAKASTTKASSPSKSSSVGKTGVGSGAKGGGAS